MIEILSKIFIKDRHDVKHPDVRRRYGVMMSVIGIIANVLLSAAKFSVGLLSGSISVTADAANNLSDAGSQAISFLSFKISAKPADRDHPFGHARIEYVASMIVSFIVLLVGFELAKESVIKIFYPEEASFNLLLVIVLSVSVVVKLWLGLNARRVSKRIGSSVIAATATDSLSDAAATSAILVSAFVSEFTDFNTDAYMGIAVSVLIVIAGVKILNETKNSILGSPPEPEVVEAIVAITKEYEGVCGIHDMVVHNYGPGNTIASLHAEVDGSENVYVIHDMIDNLEKRLYSELGVRATIHMDPIVTDDERVAELRELALGAVRRIDRRISIHDFRFVEGVTHSNLIFDVSVPFEIKISDSELADRIQQNVSEKDASLFTVITVDRQ